MLDHKEALSKLIENYRSQLGAEWTEDDIAHVVAGEEELALEIFCDQVSELEIRILEDDKQIIQSLIVALEIDKSYLTMITNP